MFRAKKKATKEQVVNSLEYYLDEITVTLPNSKAEISLSDLIENADDLLIKNAKKRKNKDDDDEMDNEDHDDEKENEDDDDEMDNEDDDEKENEDDDDEKENEDDYDDEDEMKKKNMKKKKNKMKRNMGKKHSNSSDKFREIVKEELKSIFSKSENFQKLSNAHLKKKPKDSVSSLNYTTKAEQVAKGKENY